MEALAIFNLALEIAEKILPQLKKELGAGTITPEQQKEVRDAYQKFRDLGQSAFAGPEWEVEK